MEGTGYSVSFSHFRKNTATGKRSATALTEAISSTVFWEYFERLSERKAMLAFETPTPDHTEAFENYIYIYILRNCFYFPLMYMSFASVPRWCSLKVSSSLHLSVGLFCSPLAVLLSPFHSITVIPTTGTLKICLLC